MHNFFTTASITETHSMTVTEALCCKVPVVVANHPSMTYFTETTGHYFEPMQPASLGQALHDMWSNESIYAPKKAAAEHMLEEFDGRKVAMLYLDFYNKLLTKKKHK